MYEYAYMYTYTYTHNVCEDVSFSSPLLHVLILMRNRVLWGRNKNKNLKYIYNWGSDTDCLGNHTHAGFSLKLNFRAIIGSWREGSPEGKEPGMASQTL